MMNMMAISVAILAGGQGRRMGGVNKALLSVRGDTIIERQLREARKVSDDIIVVCQNEDMTRYLSAFEKVRSIPDQYIGEGPLAGVHAGLSAATHPFVWVLGCDMPYPDFKVVRYLIERMQKGAYDAVIPCVGGRPQPLHAIYRKELGAVAGQKLQTGERKLMALFDQANWLGIEEQELTANGFSSIFSDDIDTPEQYANANSPMTDDR